MAPPKAHHGRMSHAGRIKTYLLASACHVGGLRTVPIKECHTGANSILVRQSGGNPILRDYSVGWKSGFRTTQTFPDYPDWWTTVHRSPIQFPDWFQTGSGPFLQGLKLDTNLTYGPQSQIRVIGYFCVLYGPGTRYLVPSTWYPGIRCLVFGRSWYHVPDTRGLVPGT